MKTKWTIINKEAGKVHSVEQVPTLLVNDEKLRDPTNFAFNNFFTTITEKLNVQHIEQGDAIHIIKDLFVGKCPSIKLIPISEGEIKNITHSLKKKIIRL